MKVLLVILLLVCGPVFAVQPDEMLRDPALEARARPISQGLRCLVCRNESIDESHASLAGELRLLVRERLVAGDSDPQVMAFLVERYGEFVLLRPTVTGSNLILWIAAPGMVLAAAVIAGLYARRRGGAVEPAISLSAEERARLNQILKE